MKNIKLLNLASLDAAELQQVQGGVTEGGCILPLIKFPPFFPTLPKFPPFIIP
jgi:hypothetical protein